MVTTSSAFPPGFQNLTKYSRVHEMYSNWRRENLNKNPVIDFRRVVSDDIAQLEELHKELFPIVYDSQFYEGISSGITHGWVAIWKLNENSELDSFQNHELIVGFITTSQDSRIIKENDYKYVIRNIPEKFMSEELKDKIQNEESIINNHQSFGADLYKYLVYILTMGVIEEFRFLGIAKQLLNIVIGYYYKFNPEVNAIYLHVIDYNNNAINLYKRLKFAEIVHWDHFYKISDDFYGAFLFSYYFDRSTSNMNMFDKIMSNTSNIQQKKKYEFINYFNRFISNSSKYLRNFN